MRIPFVGADPGLLQAVEAVCAQPTVGGTAKSPKAGHFQIAPLPNVNAAIEYVNYQMPQLILINFSDPEFDGFELMRHIVSDPWLNHGAIIALFKRSETLGRINALQNTNIVLTMQYSDVPQQLPKVLDEIWNNRQILFQRALQQELFSDITGQFVLANDVAIVPFYSNLLANYLYNMGFIESDRKTSIAFSLTEMLINAIEHGNCGISAEEKSERLASGGSIAKMIEERCQDPRVSARRVLFSYELRPGYSAYVIRDEGRGFDWRKSIARREIDFLAEHGRGIFLTARNVARIAYNDAGNEVTLRIEHRRNVSNALPNLIGNSELVEFQPDEVVFRQGEESTFLYYIAEGEYRVEINNHHVSTINPSDLLVGEMSFLLEEMRSATVIANSKGKLIKITKEALVETIKSKPYYGIFLAKLIAQRLQRLGQRVMS